MANPLKIQFVAGEESYEVRAYDYMDGMSCHVGLLADAESVGQSTPGFDFPEEALDHIVDALIELRANIEEAKRKAKRN